MRSFERQSSTRLLRVPNAPTDDADAGRRRRDDGTDARRLAALPELRTDIPLSLMKLSLSLSLLAAECGRTRPARSTLSRLPSMVDALMSALIRDLAEPADPGRELTAEDGLALDLAVLAEPGRELVAEDGRTTCSQSSL